MDIFVLVVSTLVLLAMLVFSIVSLKKKNKNLSLFAVILGISIVASLNLTVYVSSVFLAILIIPVISASYLLNAKLSYIVIAIGIVVIIFCMTITLVEFYQHEIYIDYEITITDSTVSVVLDKIPNELETYIDNAIKSSFGKIADYSNAEIKGRIIVTYFCDYPRNKNHECECNNKAICENCKKYVTLNGHNHIILEENIIE